MAQVEVQRAYRVALDPTRTQMEALKSHAGASRAAYNYHLTLIRPTGVEVARGCDLR